MEKIAYTLKSLLEKKKRLYQDLVEVLAEEQTLIGSIDVDRLWETSARKKSIAREIQAVRDRLLTVLEENRIPVSSHSKGFDPAALIRDIPMSTSLRSDLMALCVDLTTVKQEIHAMALRNRRNIDECLGVFSGLISTIVGQQPDRQYTGYGVLKETRRQTGMIRAEV